MFSAEELILQFRHFLFGSVDSLAKFVADPEIVVSAMDFGALVQFLIQLVPQLRDGHAHLFEERSSYALCLIEQGKQEMLVSDFLLVELRGKILCRLQGFLHFLGKLIRSHDLAYCSPVPRQLDFKESGVTE